MHRSRGRQTHVARFHLPSPRGIRCATVLCWLRALLSARVFLRVSGSAGVGRVHAAPDHRDQRLHGWRHGSIRVRARLLVQLRASNVTRREGRARGSGRPSTQLSSSIGCVRLRVTRRSRRIVESSSSRGEGEEGEGTASFPADPSASSPATSRVRACGWRHLRGLINDQW